MVFLSTNYCLFLLRFVNWASIAEFLRYARPVVNQRCVSPQAFSARQSLLLSFLVTVAVAALGFGLNSFLFREGIPRRDLMLMSSSIIGIVAGLLFYQFLRNERIKHEVVQQRMRTIAELNHHIRNALQVIRYAGGSKSSSDASQLQLINEAVARIDWALREVLPKYPVGAPVEKTRSESAVPAFSSAVVDDFVLRHKEARPQ